MLGDRLPRRLHDLLRVQPTRRSRICATARSGPGSATSRVTVVGLPRHVPARAARRARVPRRLTPRVSCSDSLRSARAARRATVSADDAPPHRSRSSLSAILAARAGHLPGRRADRGRGAAHLRRRTSTPHDTKMWIVDYEGTPYVRIGRASRARRAGASACTRTPKSSSCAGAPRPCPVHATFVDEPRPRTRRRRRVPRQVRLGRLVVRAGGAQEPARPCGSTRAVTRGLARGRARDCASAAASSHASTPGSSSTARSQSGRSTVQTQHGPLELGELRGLARERARVVGRAHVDRELDQRERIGRRRRRRDRAAARSACRAASCRPRGPGRRAGSRRAPASAARPAQSSAT